MENKFFVTTIFLIFGLMMITSHLNFAIAADDEGGDKGSGGGDDKGGGSDDKKSDDKGGNDDNDKKDSSEDKKDKSEDKKEEQLDNKEKETKSDESDVNDNSKTEESDINDNQGTQLSSSNDDNDKPSGDAIIKSTPSTSTPPTEEEKEKEKAESDVQQQDSADIIDNSNSKPYYEKDAGDAIISDKPSKQQYEDEKAAIEDYIYDEPGKVKPYSTEGVKEPWKIKLIESLNAEAEQQNKPEGNPIRKRTEETKEQGNDPCNYFGQNICEGSKDGKTCNEEKFDCLSDTKDKDGNWNYCTTGKCPGDDKPYDKPPGIFKPVHNPECNNPHFCINKKPKIFCHDGNGHICGHPPEKVKCGKWNNWCHDEGKDKGKNWYCKHHDCHHHNHHNHDNHDHDSHTSFHYNSGDVTVKINVKYEEESAKNLDHIDTIVGDVYEKVLDLSDKPDQITIDSLGINGGDDFAVCLANEDSQNGDCTVATADNDHDTVTVYLTAK
jgi:hypothetical protein